MNNWEAGILGFFIGMLATYSAQAEQRSIPTDMYCAADIASAANSLERVYGETPQFGGRTSAEAGLMMFANPETGTWTLILVLPDGAACSPATGTDYAAIPQGEQM